MGVRNVKLFCPFAIPSNVTLNSDPEPPTRGVVHAPATSTCPGVVRLGTIMQLAWLDVTAVALTTAGAGVSYSINTR